MTAVSPEYDTGHAWDCSLYFQRGVEFGLMYESEVF